MPRYATLLIALIVLLGSACAVGDSPPTPVVPSPTTAPSPTPVPQPTVEPVTELLFTGDLIPARCAYAQIEGMGGDYTLPFQPLHDTLVAADITIGSLDATASDAGTPFGCTPTFSLAAPAKAVEGFKYAGYDVIAHAANHIKDCGVESCGDRAMTETDANLREAGIKTMGSGANLTEARAPVVVERNGIYFAFLAYDDIANYYNATVDSPGSAPLDPSTIAEDVAAAKKVANVVIIVPHWGVEYTADPSERQHAFALAASRAGADMIIGNHPHWVQAHEMVGKMFVAYALGNFVFDQDWSVETQQGAMLEVTFTGTRMTGYRYTPIHIYDRFQPRLTNPAEAYQIMQRIEGASARLVADPPSP